MDGPDKVMMIYPTAVGGEVWHMPSNPKNDSRFNATGITGNPGDGFQVSEDFPIMTIETSGGYNFGATIPDISHSYIKSVGFMYKSNDFRDVEITGYFNCSQVPADSDARIMFFARSGELSDLKPWCPGSFYRGELAMDGRFRWVKGQYHLSYSQKDWIDSGKIGLGTNLREIQWFGFKIVMYNVDIGVPGEGKEGVKLECFIDRANSNTWEFVETSDVIDTGGWGEDGEICGGNRDQIITWGGPLVSIKFDYGANILFKKLSAREISPGAKFANPAASIPPPGFAAANRVLASTRHLYRIGTFIAPTCLGEVGTDPEPPPPPPGGGLVTVTKKIAHQSKIIRTRGDILTLPIQVSSNAGE